jgi:hypothetical protein
MLIRGLAEVFSLVDSTTLEHWERMHAGINGCKSLYAIARCQMQAGYVDEAISSVLSCYEEQIHRIMATINTHLSVLSASKRAVWRTAYNTWVAGSLSETRALRMA